MLNVKFDSYGYDGDSAFISMTEKNRLKYKQGANVERKLTELGSFFSEAGQETVVLNQWEFKTTDGYGSTDSQESDQDYFEPTPEDDSLSNPDDLID